MAENTKLSVIIPCYKRHELSVRHLREVLLSSYQPDEAILINDGGDPVLEYMIEAMLKEINYCGRTKIIYSRIEQDILWNYNGACNLAFWISTGDYIAIEDTDHIPERILYERALEFIKNNPDVDRIAYNRKCVDISELNKPLEEWHWTKKWSPNQMVSILKRDAYIRLKGQEERFGGFYGYLCYDWKNRYNNILKIKTMKVDAHYYAIIGDGGEPGLKRGMSPENRRIYKENANSGHPQHPRGVLNFTYSYKVLYERKR